MTKAEMIKRYGLEWYEQYKARKNAQNKERYHNDPEYKARHDMYSKERYHNDPEYRKRHNKACVKSNMKRYNSDTEYKQRIMDEHKDYVKDKYANDKNYKLKHNTRTESARILFDKRHHSRIKGYEIHHAFGYGDPSKFIYVPRELHRAIHRFLRDNNIDADSNHFNSIAQLINECTEYMYISA